MKTITFSFSHNTRALFYCLIALPLFASCDSTNRYAQQSVRHQSVVGSVSNIEIISTESRTSGGGAVLGAILGGVVGHQMGGGRGRDLATGIGVVGGAVAGNQVEKRGRRDSEIYRITVRLDNGRTQVFDYKEIEDLQVGDRVQVKGSQLYQL